MMIRKWKDTFGAFLARVEDWAMLMRRRMSDTMMFLAFALVRTHVFEYNVSYFHPIDSLLASRLVRKYISQHHTPRLTNTLPQPSPPHLQRNQDSLNGHPFSTLFLPVFSFTTLHVKSINRSPNSTSFAFSLPGSTIAGGQIYCPDPSVTVAANIVLTQPSNWVFLNGAAPTLIAYPASGYASWMCTADCRVSTMPGCVALERMLGYLECRWRSR